MVQTMQPLLVRFCWSAAVLGLPVEGWILQWTDSMSNVYNYVMERLMGELGVIPTTFQITSTDQIQSALWVGTIGPEYRYCYYTKYWCLDYF
jgi:hypothetical protein